MRIAVVDGLGGGIGCQIIESLVTELDASVEIVALGVNSAATSNMLKAGAHRGATGENAIRVTARHADVIVGPIGIIIPDSMMGEITAQITNAIIDSAAKKFLLSIGQPHVEIIGTGTQPIGVMMKRLTRQVSEFAQGCKTE